MIEYIITSKQIIEENKNPELLIENFLILYEIEQDKQEFKVKYDFYGFNYYDKKILLSIAEFYIEHNFVSYKQMKIIKKLIFKYCSQIAEIKSILINLESDIDKL